MFSVLSVELTLLCFTQGYMVSLQNARRIAVNICIPRCSDRIAQNAGKDNTKHSLGNLGKLTNSFPDVPPDRMAIDFPLGIPVAAALQKSTLHRKAPKPAGDLVDFDRMRSYENSAPGYVPPHEVFREPTWRC